MTIRIAKTKALISCAFGFAYADCWFSHEAARILEFDILARLQVTA